ncbi:MAG: hypothetical protein LBK61_01555 [Spirochaetaceae bacterium]|nr:hypothetical protein [Spirochaetaceae bacterium]
MREMSARRDNVQSAICVNLRNLRIFEKAGTKGLRISLITPGAIFAVCRRGAQTWSFAGGCRKADLYMTRTARIGHFGAAPPSKGRPRTTI